MIVGIYGLGLIGGSMAKAYKANSDHKVYAYDKDETTLGFARLSGAIDAKLDSENIGDCDLVMIALYPQAAVECMKERAPKLKKDATVIDLCGTKAKICECGFFHTACVAEQYCHQLFPCDRLFWFKGVRIHPFDDPVRSRPDHRIRIGFAVRNIIKRIFCGNLRFSFHPVNQRNRLGTRYRLRR